MNLFRIPALRLLAVVAAGLLVAQIARAADAPDADLLPAASVPAEAIGVSWLDLRPMDGPTVAATSEALAPLAGGEDDQYLQWWKAVAEVAGSLRDAGVEVVALPLDQSLVTGETVEPAGRDAPATRPAEQPWGGVGAVYFLRLRPGADRAAVEAAFNTLIHRLNAADTPGHAPDPAKIRFRPRGDRWLDALPEPSMTPPDGDAAATERFAAALADAAPDGPPLRLAVVLSDAARRQLADAAKDPSAGPFRGVIDGVRTMDHATVAMTLGGTPQWTAALRLPDPASAVKLKRAIDAATALAALSLANTDDPKYAEYVRAQLSLATFEQDGPRLSRTVAVPTLLRIKQLGEAGDAPQEAPPK